MKEFTNLKKITTDQLDELAHGFLSGDVSAKELAEGTVDALVTYERYEERQPKFQKIKRKPKIRKMK